MLLILALDIMHLYSLKNATIVIKRAGVGVLLTEILLVYGLQTDVKFSACGKMENN